MGREPSEMSYFQIQAYMGTTKHMGGLETTRELIVRCGIEEETYVLDVGCGAGATACYLASTYCCRVVGVDVMEEMVELSRARAEREGVSERTTFRVADARQLPFDDASFDVVLCESVATFVVEKEQVVGELARVTREGGCVGLNEDVWLQTPPEADGNPEAVADEPVSETPPESEGDRVRPAELGDRGADPDDRGVGRADGTSGPGRPRGWRSVCADLPR